MYAQRSGTDPNAEAVAMGSHLDTVPKGGKFDGAYGMMAGLEVMRCLQELDLETRRPVELTTVTR